MRTEPLLPKWTHATATAKAAEALRTARARAGGEMLHPLALLDLEDLDTLARATVRRESLGWPAPGPGFAFPFIMCARGRARQGAIGIVSGSFAVGLVADLLIFFPFGFSHRGLFVEVPEPGIDQDGDGYYSSREGWRALYYDVDDRFLWRDNRLDETAEAFEFLVREAREKKAGRQ